MHRTAHSSSKQQEMMLRERREAQRTTRETQACWLLVCWLAVAPFAGREEKLGEEEGPPHEKSRLHCSGSPGRDGRMASSSTTSTVVHHHRLCC